MKELGFGPLAVHAAYLANLAGPDPVFRAKTIELLRRVRLEDRADTRMRTLSGGMQQRFSIVAALVNQPDLVFFGIQVVVIFLISIDLSDELFHISIRLILEIVLGWIVDLLHGDRFWIE